MQKKLADVRAVFLCCALVLGFSLAGCAKAQAAGQSDTAQPKGGQAAQKDAPQQAKPSLNAEQDLVYTFDKLKIAASYAVKATLNAANGIDLNLTQQWAQIVFAVPDEIDFSKVVSVTVKPSKGTDGSGLAIKFINEEGLATFSEVEVNYGGTTLRNPNKDGIKYVGLMNMSDQNRSVSFDNITFRIDPNKERPTGIESDIGAWKDSITAAFGADAVAGAAIMYNEFSDKLLMDLVEHHFNAVTFGNELKPDALLGGTPPGANVKTEKIDGKPVVVPAKLNLKNSNAEKMLAEIKKWNDANPKSPIKVRGHVLVWHSQTPEWFFHEDYNPAKPYADKATMTLREEWYIKSVLTYFAGKDSPYKDLFYGWDVVNEAVSDSSGSYRTDKENSSWWAVFQSNEFITNAFVFANKYAPKGVELYYNDYGETSPQKSKGIVQLLKDVKATGGARIDGFGMQAHYQTDTFSAKLFEDAARAYAAVVGKIMLTELDFQTSRTYIATVVGRQNELVSMAKRHKEIFDVLKKLSAEKAADVRGIVTWGVIEPNSWLHVQATVGGGADGTRKQCPLLFDGNYKAKPAYWAYVDPTRMEK